MNLNIIPYDDMVEEGTENNHIVIKFHGLDTSFFVNDTYCVAPGCNCAETVLRVIEVDDESLIKEWFTIRLDLQTFEAIETSVVDETVDAEKYIHEFMNHIDVIKDELLSHYAVVENYRKKPTGERISNNLKKMLLDGDMVGYSEIFGNHEMDKFNFEISEDDKWFFDDQYCSNPKCLCNEVVLTFYNINSSKETQLPEFAVRMDINSLKYNVEYNSSGTGRIPEVIRFLRDSESEVFQIIKQRYYEVKKIAKEVITKDRLDKKKEERQGIKVGRNEPCPCGSGKKFKKCCGR